MSGHRWYYSLNILSSDGLVAQCLTPNQEDQVICDRDFLALAFEKSISSCKAAVATLVHPGYFISLVPAKSGEHSPSEN